MYWISVGIYIYTPIIMIIVKWRNYTTINIWVVIKKKVLPEPAGTESKIVTIYLTYTYQPFYIEILQPKHVNTIRIYTTNGTDSKIPNT